MMRALLLLLCLIGVAAPAVAQDAPAANPPADDVSPPVKPPPPLTAAPPPPSWQPRQTAVLQALDKLSGEVATLAIPVGSTQDFRNISIDVRSCYTRPPDQAQDATAFLSIQDKGGTVPSFVGWLLAAEPSAAILEHPVYDVRVLSCR